MTKQPLGVYICAAVVVIGIVATGLMVNRNHSASDEKPVSSKSQTAKSTATSNSKNSSTTSAKSTPSPSPSPAAAATPTSTVVKVTNNSDGTTTKTIVVTSAIQYSSQTQNDANVKRGTTQVVAGQNGVETITYAVTYDQNGKEISRKTISDVTTKQPIAQITKVGVSDYNLNSDTWDGTEFGEMCLPADYGSASDGCIGVASDAHFSAVSISGTFYVSCVSSVSGTCGANATVNIQPIIPIQGGTFSYSGSTYRADPRAGGGQSTALTSAICSQYGLACGSW